MMRARAASAAICASTDRRPRASRIWPSISAWPGSRRRWTAFSSRARRRAAVSSTGSVTGFDPGHWARLNAYEKALRERARLLRDDVVGNGRRRLACGARRRSWPRTARRLAAARIEAVTRLDAACRSAKGPFPRAGLAVEGAVETWIESMPALAAEEEFRSSLARHPPPRRRKRRHPMRPAPLRSRWCGISEPASRRASARPASRRRC